MRVTGKTDLAGAIAGAAGHPGVVSEGVIFRFLTKPLLPDLFLKALEAAVEHHRSRTAERVLLEPTSRGSIKALTDILAMVSPAAFGRSMAAQAAISRLTKQGAIAPAWQAEISAMLSQIGCGVLPAQAADKAYQGEALREDEQAMVERIPVLVEELLSNIPQLEPVREILPYQQKNRDGAGLPHDGVLGEAVPRASRALPVVLDRDVPEAESTKPGLGFDTLTGRSGSCVPFGSLARVHGGAHEASPALVRELQVGELKLGMVLVADVKTVEGVLLIARGQEVTSGVIRRIQKFDSEVGVKQPLRVVTR